MRRQYLVEKNMSMVRLNFAPHPYLYPDLDPETEIKTNVDTALYTSFNALYIDNSLRGIEECKDFGSISINPQHFMTRRTE